MNAMLRTACMLVAVIFTCSAISYGQAPKVSKKQELMQHMLKEKLRLPGKIKGGSESMRTTAGSDGRVSALPSNISESEISLAYNPVDSSKIVLSYMEESTSGLSFPIYYSSDAGSTWTKSNFNSTNILAADFPGQFAGGGGDPVFAWDKNGTLYYGWIYLSVKLSFDTAFFTLNWAYSTDNGHTWSVKPKHFVGEGALDIISGGAYNYKDGVTDREWFAVDNSGGPHQGNLYCSYVCFPPGTAGVYMGVKTKLPGVDTFGPAVHAFDGDAQFGNVDVSNAGVLHMSFADLGSSKIRHTKSTDGGASFVPSVIVSSAAAVFPNPPYIVHTRENAAVSMAVGDVASSNDVHIVWSDFPGTTVNSFYSRSTDGGSTWSTPVSLDTLMHGMITLMPTVAAHGRDVAISFTGVDGSDSARYYELNSTNSGLSFDMERTLSSAACNYKALGAHDTSSSLFFGDYNRSQRTHCLSFASWEDCRNNVGAKVYFAKTNYCSLGIREISMVNGDARLLAIYPNPATDRVALSINSSVIQDIDISITDVTGKVQAAFRHELQTGTQEVSLPLGNLANGVYVIALKSKAGIIATRQLIVQ